MFSWFNKSNETQPLLPIKSNALAIRSDVENPPSIDVNYPDPLSEDVLKEIISYLAVVSFNDQHINNFQNYYDSLADLSQLSQVNKQLHSLVEGCEVMARKLVETDGIKSISCEKLYLKNQENESIEKQEERKPATYSNIRERLCEQNEKIIYFNQLENDVIDSKIFDKSLLKAYMKPHLLSIPSSIIGGVILLMGQDYGLSKADTIGVGSTMLFGSPLLSFACGTFFCLRNKRIRQKKNEIIKDVNETLPGFSQP